MSEVELVRKDNLSAEQWGRTNPFYQFFFETDGKKHTLKRKRATAIAFSFFSLIIVSQFLITSENPNRVGNSSITVPTEFPAISEFPEANVPEVAQSTRAKKTAVVKLSAPQVFERPRDLKRIPPGSLIKAKLVTGASNGLVRAESLEPVKVNGDTIIEKGTVFLGTGSSGEERLSVTFNHAVFRDGTFSQINAYACDDSDKIVGLKGSRVGSRALNIAGGIGLGFLGGFSQGLQDKQGQQGAVVTEPSMKNALLNGTSVAALEQSKSLISEIKDKPSILEVPMGTSICVLFAETR